MRKLSLVAGVAVVLASQGCTLKIPTGLLNGAFLQGSLPGATAVPGTPANTKPGVTPPVMPKPPVQIGQACTAASLAVLNTYDANGDKALDLDEFVRWYEPAAQANACPVPEDAPEGQLISNNAGGLITAAGGGLKQRRVQSTIAIAGHGVIISNNSGTVIAGNGNVVVSNNGSGIISNNAVGLISDNAGPGVICNDGGCPGDQPPMPSCGGFPDPKTAFQKADRNGDGRIDLQELCEFPFFPVQPPDGTYVPMPTPPKPPMPIGNDCKTGFQRADLNQDGVVTPDEFFKARGVPYDGPQLATNQALPPEFVNAIMVSNKGDFARRDANGDGRIDPGEWCNYQPVPIPLPRPSFRPQPMPACDLATADYDGDGQVSWEEYFEANTPVFEGVDDVAVYGDAKGLAYAGFKALDRNGDGLLDQAEMCAQPPVQEEPLPPQPLPQPSGNGQCGSLFDTWDADGDQQISFDEYADAKWNELRFLKAPTADEEQATRAKFASEAKQYDANGNGSLDFIEFLKVCPSYVPNTVAVSAGRPNVTPTPTPGPVAIQ